MSRGSTILSLNFLVTVASVASVTSRVNFVVLALAVLRDGLKGRLGIPKRLPVVFNVRPAKAGGSGVSGVKTYGGKPPVTAKVAPYRMPISALVRLSVTMPICV